MLKERYSLETIEEEIVVYGLTSFLLLHRLIERFTENEGMSFGEFAVLMHLRGRKSEINLNVLKSNVIVFSGASITKIIDKLFRNGYVKRRVNPGSRREKLVKITPAGKKTVARLAAEFSKLSDGVTDGFSAADKKRLLKDLGQLLRNGMTIDGKYLPF
jgi:DNA-binding MarR family transcriptional regulator